MPSFLLFHSSNSRTCGCKLSAHPKRPPGDMSSRNWLFSVSLETGHTTFFTSSRLSSSDLSHSMSPSLGLAHQGVSICGKTAPAGAPVPPTEPYSATKSTRLRVSHQSDWGLIHHLSQLRLKSFKLRCLRGGLEWDCGRRNSPINRP